MTPAKETSAPPAVDVQQLVVDNDFGGRSPGPAVGFFLLCVALAWSLFQLWIASPLPFTFGVLVFNDTESRAIHLAFAVFLAYLSYPAFKRSPRERVPLTDWVLGVVAAFCASYLFLFYRDIATRPGNPTQMDIYTAVVGMALLLEATRRVLGLPMVVVALVFLIYTFGGRYMPDMIAHRGFSLNRAMSHQWLTTEGVFGVALGVSSGFIFLFVLFGSLLDKAGAGNYFIKSAFALLGGSMMCVCDPNNAGTSHVRARFLALGISLLAVAVTVLAWQLDLWRWRIVWPQADTKDWPSLGRLLVWFTWPAWPLALWTLWRWRKQIWNRQLHRHLMLPLWFVLISMGASLCTQPADRALLLGLPALAALAAFALPTLRRSVAALIDWFTLLFFSVSAIAIWVVWVSTQTGIPAKPAANVAKLARGFEPEFSFLAFAVALAASAAWCALVGWRTGRDRKPIWKSLVLPASGATLSWLLLMTLWLPMLNYARSDAPQMHAIVSAAHQPPCMHMFGLGRSQIAALQFHGQLRLTPLASPPSCPWLVWAQQIDATDLPMGPPWMPDLNGWTLNTTQGRPTDRNDALLLYRYSAP